MHLLFQRLFSWWKANGIPQEADGWEECEPAARPVPYAMWLPGPLWCLCETQAISVPWMLEVLCWLLLAAYASLAISFYQVWPVCLAEQPACPTQGAPALSLNEGDLPYTGDPAAFHFCPWWWLISAISSGWCVLCAHVSPSAPVGQRWVLSLEDKGIAASTVGESMLCPASEPAMSAPCEFMGFLSVALSLFTKQRIWQVYLLIQDISWLVRKQGEELRDQLW